jgi:hypothetical protein
MALRFFIIAALVSFFAYRRTRKEEDAFAISVDEEFRPDIDWTTFDGDPKEEQGYYINQGHDVDSSFYEVRQYQEDRSISLWGLSVSADQPHPWLPGIDREFALVLTSDFSREQYSSYWQTIFVLDCKHYLPSIYRIESTQHEETYCFICRGLPKVVKIVSRKSIFPAEGESIKTREDWMRGAEIARDSRT